ncbi:hypothetical protein ACQR0Z_15125 [Bradyrhizobium sp. HKCCYLS3077]|uniref:hypothetical protein n=1 Tax=Bradyrhizobium sp. HKCCYLS3077 TaxID=3420761 RepID=UPI003EBA6AEB
MAPTKGKWQVYEPTGRPVGLKVMPKSLAPRVGGGGTLIFNSSSQTQYIFSPIGYSSCILNAMSDFWEVGPTFGETLATTIEATEAECLPDGTVVFSNVDGSVSPPKYPVAYLSPQTYAYIAYDGIATPQADM